MTDSRHDLAGRPTPINLFKRHFSGYWDLDEELRARVERRARALWDAAGSPEGHELTYRFRAEQELENMSVAIEEGPFAVMGEHGPIVTP